MSSTPSPARPTASSYLFFAQSSIGLESLLEAELALLGLSSKAVEGGVEFRGGQEELWRVALSSRLSESLRIRLKSFEAREFSTLEKALRKLPFRAYFEKGAQVRVKVVCHKSRLWHSSAVQERVEGVLSKFVGLEVKGEAADNAHSIHLRLFEDQVQVSLDATGERMHRRGYRSRVERASLRETLASALVTVALRESKKNAGSPLLLWDPFCGAGTIPLEALSWGHGSLAGASRAHAFEDFRNHDAAAFQAWKDSWLAAAKEAAPAPTLRVFGSDQSARALESAQANSQALGLEEFATWKRGDILDIVPEIPQGALVVTNPPYGKRLADTGAITKLRSVLAQRPDLRPAFLLVGGAARKALSPSCPALFRTKNGGIPVSARLVQG